MRIDSMTTRLLPIAAIACFTWAVAAQDQKPADPPTDDAQAETAEQEALPSLDDLLGIETEESDNEEGAGIDPDRAELDRALSGEQVADMFVQAVQQMADAADLLEVANTPGAPTQRLQDEIIRKLDILIEQAKQQQSSSSSSSSSNSDSSSQSQGQQPNQPQPGQQQQQGEQQQDQANQGDNLQEGTPPGFQDGPLADRLDELHAAWGALPTRIREALSQGSGDEFSTFYQSMTESYYRKLAGDQKTNEERDQ